MEIMFKQIFFIGTHREAPLVVRFDPNSTFGRDLSSFNDIITSLSHTKEIARKRIRILSNPAFLACIEGEEQLYVRFGQIKH